MFKKILIANRGEIAVRVARTAKRLGIQTVAVYSEADADAMHVSMCDEAYLIGGPAPRDSYLRGDLVLEIAKLTGAEAIHPGYGFLSENEAFARDCAASGVVFIGPPPAAILAMGLKAESKRLMEKAGVPLVPGYHGADQDAKLLASEAARIGFPVLIKASAGGGGKGMKVAQTAAEFADALASAKREANNSFGDDNVLIERYLLQPRHIEIQVFADTMGNCVYLFERDCSLQRRHQKVIEEAPAPGMSEARRKQMGEAAVAAAKAVNYVGAGTVEFIAEHDFESSGRFYFMEMNTRLQVEHPVTEMITGLDLVEWQLRVASGEPLPNLQNELHINGHAFEARVYAENPHNQFLPAIGPINVLRTPKENKSLRIDTGIRKGDEITPHYDPMVAKLIVHGATRADALQRLALALDEYAVLGFDNNVEFLQRVARHPAFAAAKIDTGFIARHEADLIPPLPEATDTALLACAVFEQTSRVAGGSPWDVNDGFWLGDTQAGVSMAYQQGEFKREVKIISRDGKTYATVGENCYEFTSHIEGECVALTISGALKRAQVIAHADSRLVLMTGARFAFTRIDPLFTELSDDSHAGYLTAPMPGSIVSVLVKAGDKVTKGQPLVIMEAMKMEHTILATNSGVVSEVYFAEREQVAAGAELVAIDIEEAKK